MVQVEARSENRSKQGEAGSRKGRNVWAKEERLYGSHPCNTLSTLVSVSVSVVASLSFHALLPCMRVSRCQSDFSLASAIALSLFNA